MRKFALSLLLMLFAFPLQASEMINTACAPVAQSLKKLGAKITTLDFHYLDYKTGVMSVKSTASGKLYHFAVNSRQITSYNATAAIRQDMWLVSTPLPGKSQEEFFSIYAVHQNYDPSYPTRIRANTCTVVLSGNEYLLQNPQSVPADFIFEPLPEVSATACHELDKTMQRVKGAMIPVTIRNIDVAQNAVTYQSPGLTPQPIVYVSKDSFLRAVGHGLRGSWFAVSPPVSALLNPSLTTNDTQTPRPDFALVGVSEDGRSCTPLYQGGLTMTALPPAVRQKFGY